MGANLHTWRGIKLTIKTPGATGTIVVEEIAADVSDVFGIGAAPF